MYSYQVTYLDGWTTCFSCGINNAHALVIVRARIVEHGRIIHIHGYRLLDY